ncbi:PepSY domain-containing protein [Dokdonella ginsengisoli]|uniref:PepSY domain-containing protein n=1 Tax=Dokdonella ginsengisoli TaxID=363846 RepID=UPI0036D3EF5A
MQARRGTSLLVLFLMLSCAAIGSAPVVAREVSVQEAVAQAQRQADGKVLSVQTLNVGKRKVYRVKILTRDGQVRVIQVPAEQ